MLKETNNHMRLKYLTCLLSGLVLLNLYLYFYSAVYTFEKQKSSNTLKVSYTESIVLKFKQGDKTPLDFSSKEVTPAVSETSAANIQYSPKSQKNTTAALIKLEAISKSFKLYLNTLNNNFSIIDFDNLAGFLIQKQLKTNA